MSTIVGTKSRYDANMFDQPAYASRFLEQALLVAIVCHAAAMVSMAILLLPGMPGGNNALSGRATYVAANPWLWRLGWLPWRLTALAGLLLSVALLRTTWSPRFPAILALLTTVVALVVEKPGQLAW